MVAKVRIFLYICPHISSLIFNPTLTEIQFMRQNRDKWTALQELCKSPLDYEPDELASAYGELTTDLAYAQTHFAQAPITAYLNDMASSLHMQIYRKRPFSWHHLLRFMTHDVPLALYECRRTLLVAFVVFAVGVVLGTMSQVVDPQFARVVMGDFYMNMTEENIRQGTPMAVYDQMAAPDMFLSITFNNVSVSLLTYVCGLFTVFGTGIMLLSNAVMLGCFQTYFVQQGLGWESALAIWLHGTLEISMIVLAGAAGFKLGMGWLYPGTLSRMQAFQQSAKSSLRVVLATIPLLAVAAFIESFFTRHVEWPDHFRLMVILSSLAFVIWYVLLLPAKLHRGKA